MAAPACSEADFIAAWRKLGSATLVAEALGVPIRSVYRRRETLERKGIVIPTVSLRPDGRNEYTQRNYAQRNCVSLADGVVVVFSDAHWWPGAEPTVAFGAMLRLIRKLRPAMVIANGDVMDAATASRHDPNGWENLPPLHAELAEVQARMAEIAAVSKGARLLRTIGNHDIRFDRRLAVQVPDYRHLAGMQLRDHLPAWQESWSVEINGATIVKHRWHGGIHATYNNTLKSGRSIVTGHLHRLQASAWTDYNGRRWGVDTGTLAEPHDPQFDYAEDSPKNWASGFAVLTFRDGVMAPPELCEVVQGRAWFRGEVIHEQKAAHQQPSADAGETAAGAGGGERRAMPDVRGRVDGGAHHQPAAVPLSGVRQAKRSAHR